ncbi:MAG: flagellar associated protein [Monoraphidium minutum]|nr:MAG: flagellar associated protein [Monoraphidium minutum]
MKLQLCHIKGFNGKLRGASVQPHPTLPGCFFYAAHSGIVVVYDDDPTHQMQLRGHDGEITVFALSHSGALLASAQRGFNCDVVLWDVARLEQTSRFQEHDIEVVAVAFSGDDRLLATIGCEAERRVFVLDTATGKIVAKSKLPEDLPRVSALAWSPARGMVYEFATAAGHMVYLWTVDPFKARRLVISTLTYSADGAWLFAGTESGDVITINVARRAMQLMHPVANGGVGFTGLAPGGKLLVGAGDGTLSLFDFQQPTHSAPPLGAVTGAVSGAAAVAGGGGRLLVGTQQGGIYWLDPLPAGAVAAPGPRPLPPPPRAYEHCQQGALTGLAYEAGGGAALATSSADGTVCVWGAADFRLQSRAAEPRAGAALCVSLTRDFSVSGRADGTLRCHARGPASGRASPFPNAGATGRFSPGLGIGAGVAALAAADAAAAAAPGGEPAAVLWSVPGAHQTPAACGVTAVEVSNRGHFVVSGGAGGEVRVWDASSRELAAHLKHHAQPITDVKVMQDDVHVLAASADRAWSLWDITQEKLVLVQHAAMGAVRGVATAPDQVSVATVGLDRAISIWDLRVPSKPALQIADAHKSESTAVAWHPGGGALASGGGDAAVRLWDWRAARAALGSYAGHTAGVARVAFSAGGGQLASGGADGCLIQWRVA